MGIPPVERFPLGGQLGILRFPCLYRQGGLAVHHAFQIVVRRREQDLLGLGQRLFPLVLEINVGLLDVLFQSLADYIQGILSRRAREGKSQVSQSLYNLKDAAKMLNFLQSNNIMDMAGLDEKFKSMMRSVRMPRFSIAEAATPKWTVGIWSMPCRS